MPIVYGDLLNRMMRLLHKKRTSESAKFGTHRDKHFVNNSGYHDICYNDVVMSFYKKLW